MQCMGFGLHILFPNHLHDMIVFLKERVSRVPIPQLHLFFFFFLAITRSCTLNLFASILFCYV